MKIIYDVGANNGDDIPYYLLKADLVVAVEADPTLAEGIRRRFEAELAGGRLVVENYVATAFAEDKPVPFYIHRIFSVLNQLGDPPPELAEYFDKTELPAKRLADIIFQYGAPHYVKIDVEGYDHELLNALFRSEIFPPYLSAESHSVDVFAALVANGNYKAFKLVDGPSVPEVYGRHTVETDAGPALHAFPLHSAGPFGNDILGDWQSPATFLRTLAQAGLGWKDIHVSRVDEPAHGPPIVALA